MFDCIFVTGGAGFIGSNFVLQSIGRGDGKVVNYDKLTYAGNLKNLAGLQDNRSTFFIRGDSNRQSASFGRDPGEISRRRWFTLPPRATSTARFPAPKSSSRRMLRALSISGSGARILEGASGGAARRFPLSACLDR